MATRPLGVEVPGMSVTVRRPGTWTALTRFCRKKPLGAAGGLIMLVMFLTAFLADQLQTYDPIATDAFHTLAPPGRAHWLGSDHLGRDIYSRIVHGARVSLIVGIA
ncbi:MAG: ABC transporter permease, partial [Candidatus Limnocylindria bacterium]